MDRNAPPVTGNGRGAMKDAPIFCLECHDTGWLAPIALWELSQPCPHCDTGAEIIAAFGRDKEEVAL